MIENLTKLPSLLSSGFSSLLGLSLESLPSGTVRLLLDDNLQGPGLNLLISGYIPGVRHTIPSKLFDSATYIVFNLPIGTVMTLMDHVVPVESSCTIANLRGCGACVDLVGTGDTQLVDLRFINMNDCLSSFFWRKVDLNLGAIELFADANFQGSRCTLFLSEWSPEKIHSISEWWLQDNISSVRWKALTDLQTVQLFEHDDGSGNSYNNIKGYGEDWHTKELADFADIQFNDGISSFSWNQLTPKKEVIKPFQIKNNSQSGYGITQTLSGTNESDSDKSALKVIINKKNVETVTVTTTNSWVTGVKSTFTYKKSNKVGDIGTDYTWSVELSFSYTRTETKSTTYTEEMSVSVEQSFVPPPNTIYTATLTANIGKIPETVYNTTAERWYDRPVMGAKQDPDNNNWYKRTEPVSVIISGGLCTDVVFSVSSQKIPKSSQP
jgi:hypothetical protein